MVSDELRGQFPEIFAAVHVDLIAITPDLVKLLIHGLGDYAKLKQQPGQPGVPVWVRPAQTVLAEAFAERTGSRWREQERLEAGEIVMSGYDAQVGTTEAAAELGISPDAVRWNCRRGNLESRKVGRQLMVSTSSIENFMRRRAERNL